MGVVLRLGFAVGPLVVSYQLIIVLQRFTDNIFKWKAIVI